MGMGSSTTHSLSAPSVVRAGEEVAPRRAILLVLKLNRDVLLLGAPPVHLSDLADVPLVVALAEPARRAKELGRRSRRRLKARDMLQHHQGGRLTASRRIDSEDLSSPRVQHVHYSIQAHEWDRATRAEHGYGPK